MSRSICGDKPTPLSVETFCPHTPLHRGWVNVAPSPRERGHGSWVDVAFYLWRQTHTPLHRGWVNVAPSPRERGHGGERKS